MPRGRPFHWTRACLENRPRPLSLLLEPLVKPAHLIDRFLIPREPLTHVQIWHALAICRVYTKKQGHKPDFDEPVVLTSDRGGTTVADFCDHLHKTLQKEFKYSLVWGTSAKHYPQRCGGL